MQIKRLALMVGAFVALALAPLASAQDLVPVRLQLKWVTQAQFAGFYAAAAQGYYEEEGLAVEILPGGPDIGPQQVVAAGGAEFGIDWMGSMLASREQGTKAVAIAQIFQRSGMRQITWADSGLETFADLRGTVTGVWGFGNQYPLFAALVKNGIDPDNPDDITIFNQPFDMVAFLNREIDSAAAMTYNEMAQVLEFVAEDGTFPVYTLEDINILDLNEEGTAMLEDLIFVNEDWLAQEGNEELAIKFLRASFRGWVYCRDNMEDCVQYVLEQGSTLGVGHQTWMMNEINKLIWPSEKGIGQLDMDLYQQTADIALNYKVISAAPDEGAVRLDLAAAALESLQADFPDVDFFGLDYEPIEVAITPNGE
ncbi:MAG: ABC transporter substrate-binding protein [Anaerolineae bacterium]|nr:ABC transporter substrate-binding protein [Anaerolineae bacterium]MDW8171774.1 ABC transporter substrate-binding protein [Anaerolineae bacterium]